MPKRPKTDRRKYLALDQVIDLTNAHSFADVALDMPLNTSLDVTWSLCPTFHENQWAKIQTKLIEIAKRFLKSHGIITEFVWVRENPGGKKPHTHIRFYAGKNPNKIRFALKDHLEKQFSFDAGGLKLDNTDFGMKTPKMRAGMFIYVLKGFDHGAFRYLGNTAMTENLGALLGINHRGSQGTVPIKRCGASKNISSTARKRAGWREVRDPNDIHDILSPRRCKVALASLAADRATTITLPLPLPLPLAA